VSSRATPSSLARLPLSGHPHLGVPGVLSDAAILERIGHLRPFGLSEQIGAKCIVARVLTPREWLRTSLAILRALRNSSDTKEVLTIEELTCRGHFVRMRRELEQTLAENAEARALLADKPRLHTDEVDYDGLRELPADSLGRIYVGHLDRNGLDPNLLATPAGGFSGYGYVGRYADSDAAYLHERYRQTHDVWHALLGLGTNGYEEILVHAFTWGQLRMPFSALVLIFGIPKHLILERRWGHLTRTLRAAWNAGFAARPLLLFYWERHWSVSAAAIRRDLRIQQLVPTHVP
jgi:ubiquinone biosynthesis protein COQ4